MTSTSSGAPEAYPPGLLARPPVRTVRLDDGQIVGTKANSWEVVDHVSEGGFSSVYRVRPADEPTQKEFGPDDRALKCLRGTADEVSQVRDEAEKIAEVEGHENVLGLVTSFRFGRPAEPGPAPGADRDGGAADIGSGGGEQSLVGLVLELGGEDLYGFARHARPDEQAWAGIFEQVAAGLDHIHGRRVVHGDIKPSNVLRVGPAFKIADFGVSRPADPASPIGGLPARTLAYLPPESCPASTPEQSSAEPASRDSTLRATTPRATTPRAPTGKSPRGRTPEAPQEKRSGWKPDQAGDVWALAVTMHRMLTGRHITAGVTPEQQYDLVCQARYSIDDRLSPGWRQLFADCLTHRREDRSITTAATLRRRLADLAVPEDYVGVPWLPGAPRVVAVLNPSTQPPTPGDGRRQEPGGAEPAGGNALVLYLTRPGGRVEGMFVTSAGVLLDATRHLHETAVPALAQQVRDAQRAAVRAQEERDTLQAEVARLAAGGPSTEIMDPAVPTEQIKKLSAEVTTAVRQRDALTRERDRLAREHDALAHRVEQLQREAAAALAPRNDYDYPPYRQPSRGRTALGCFFVVILAVTIALSIALLVGSGLAGDPPQDVINHVVDRLRDAVRGSLYG